jgi:mRNA-degrading endonuclease RelE of RelBE toxin-antitoxin system
VGGRFEVQFTTRAQKDLCKLPRATRDAILQKTELLERDPFPKGNTKRKIKGVGRPLFRLRASTSSDDFRLFYGILDNVVLVLRVVSKSQAERILKALKKGPR